MVTPCAARILPADPSNYVERIPALVAGDTLLLAPGTYTRNLILRDLAGTESAPIVIAGSTGTSPTILPAQSCCNTVSITRCAHVVIRDLVLRGDGVEVDAVKAEGTSGNWAHHITLEHLEITGYGADQQLVGISTKCHAWNWIIRRCVIIGAGTGMYLGNSDGDKPFVYGLIEYNLVADPIGYCLQIKHQNAGVRDAFAGTAVDGRTIIRHNVFSKERNASTGADARPNVLLGAFPPSGTGAADLYEMYGNFLYQNPVEALLQATGNLALHDNVFVNHSDGAGARAVYITAQNGFRPRDIRIVHNTVWCANSAGGIRLFNPDPAFRQLCSANAVFAAQPVTGFSDTLANACAPYADAALHVLNASTQTGVMDLYPQRDRLAGPAIPSASFAGLADVDRDFNGTPHDWMHRGAYSGCCANPGWVLRIDTMSFVPDPVTHITALDAPAPAFDILPNPVRTAARIRNTTACPLSITIHDITGVVRQRIEVGEGSCADVDVSALRPGIHFVRASGGADGVRRLIVLR